MKELLRGEQKLWGILLSIIHAGHAGYRGVSRSILNFKRLACSVKRALSGWPRH